MKIVKKADVWQDRIECDCCHAIFIIDYRDLNLLASRPGCPAITYAVCPFCKKKFDYYFEDLPRADQIRVLEQMKKKGKPLFTCFDVRTGQFLLPF